MISDFKLQARHEILKVHTKNMPLKEVDLELLADMTELFSGADLENMCKEVLTLIVQYLDKF